MVKIVYVDASGVEHAREVRAGLSLMEGAVRTGVPGIDADCGGACACATCHVHIEPQWLSALDPPSDVEASMLEFASAVQANSRLSCQIPVLEQLDGLRLRIPATQG
jgi:2Fe-2S ferredoxin